jgi:PAS domain S-box-containing protein
MNQIVVPLIRANHAKIINTVCNALAGQYQEAELVRLARAAIDLCEKSCVEAFASRGRIDYLVRSFVENCDSSGIDPSVAALVLSGFGKNVKAVEATGGSHGAARLYKFISSASDHMVQHLSRKRLEAKAESTEITRQMDAMKLNSIKFTTKRARCWIDVGGSRMFLLDIAGGWYNIVERIMLFAGADTSRRVLFEAGQSETFTTKALNKGVLEQTAQGFLDALDTLSEAGFGDFSVKEMRFEDAYARITCTDAFEGWAYLQKGKASELPVCHFSSGALLSFMQHTSGEEDLISTETKCIAKGDDECEFIVGRRDQLEHQGISMREWGMTIKERAESLENLLDEKEKAEKEIRKKNAELAALNEIATAVSQSLDLREISCLAIKELRKIVVDKAVIIYLLDSTKKELTLAAQEGFSEEFIAVVSKLSLGEGLSGNVANKGVPQAYDDYSSYPQAIEAAVKKEKLRSLLAVPLMAKNEVVGVLTVASKTPYHFSPEEINLLTMIGNQIGVATDKALLHKDMKESERKYKTLVEDINDGYFVCQNDRIVFANDAFLRMYGYERAEALGQDFEVFISPECVQGVRQMVTSQILGMSRLENVEFLRCHKDGRKLPTELKISLSEFEGTPAMIGIARDISERKRLEHQVLENERLASIGKLSTTLAHEIRNPLSAIKMTIQILSKNLKVQGFDKKRFDIALTEIKRLDHFLQDMLHFARPVKMKKELNSVSDIISECVELLADKLRSRNIHVSCRKPRRITKVPLDFAKMQEVFLNIMLNSMDAMPQGGEICINVEHLDAEAGRPIQVELRDTGTGIAAEHLPSIFEPFFSTKTEGAGLGLSNVKRIIEAHDADIEVISRVNYGTSIKIRFPLE